MRAGRTRKPDSTRGIVLAAGVLAAGLGLTATPLRADVREYLLEVPDQQAISFVVGFEVEHPGTVAVNAEWTGSRLLAFRLEGPGSPSVKTRRSGLSPLRMTYRVNDDAARTGGRWKLLIRALPAKGDASGKLTLELPGPPAPPDEPPKPEVAPPPEPEPWAREVGVPRSASAAVVRVFEKTEGFRAWAVFPEGVLRRDACGWQNDLLRYLADARDRSASGEPPITAATARYLHRVAEAVREVDLLQSSDDPILVGPVPEDRMRERAWLAVRRQRIEPMKAELDFLASALHRRYAPELETEPWPQRFVSCMMACERYFEQVPLVGEAKATNGDLARAQWDGFLAAAEALDALAWTLGDPETLAGP